MRLTGKEQVPKTPENGVIIEYLQEKHAQREFSDCENVAQAHKWIIDKSKKSGKTITYI